MSKESYARGFVKAAAAAGVDPVGLAKFAQWYNPLSWSGAKTNPATNPTTKSSTKGYIESLVGNKMRNSTFFHGMDFSHPGRLRPRIEHAIQNNTMLSDRDQEELDVHRRNQAEQNASFVAHKIFEDSAWNKDIEEAIRNNLIQAGIDNENAFRKDKKVPYRAVPDMRGLEGIKLKPEAMRLLRGYQNIQVKKDSPKRTSAIV